MSRISRAWKQLWTKASRSSPAVALLAQGRPVPTPREYEQLASEGYVKNSVVYRCVNLVAECAAAVPWVLYTGEGDKRKEVDDHPILRLLERPNPLQGGASLFKTLYSFKLLSGNSYLEAVAPDTGDNAGVPLELWNQRPDRMRVRLGPDGMPMQYTMTIGQEKIDWDVPIGGISPILHSKTFHPLNDVYGLSPLEPAAFDIDQHNAGGEWNYSLLKNSAKPSGAFIFQPSSNGDSDEMDEEAVDRLREQLDDIISGRYNAGRPLILEGGLDWRSMSLSPIDMDFLKGLDRSARDIAMTYDVPPQLVGVEGSQTFANFEQARLSLYEDAVLPMLDQYKDDLNGWLVPMYGDEDLELDYDENAIPALAPRRQAKWDNIGSADFLTINEKRKELGFDAIEGGDVLLVPLSVVPLEQAVADDTDDGEDDTDEPADDGEEDPTADDEEDPNVPPDESNDDEELRRLLKIAYG